MGQILVVNKHMHKPTSSDYYIGRGSPLGNPFTSKPLSKTKAKTQCNDRNESVAKFKEFINHKILEKDAEICHQLNKIWKAAQIKDIYLVCFCAPKSCHGDVIKEIIKSKKTINHENRSKK